MPQSPKLLVLDNHDSFTYNLIESCRSHLGYDIILQTPAEFMLQPSVDYTKAIISPGPGLPVESEGLFSTIAHLWGKLPLLGVCLGLQAMVEFRGGQIERSVRPFHGLGSELQRIDKEDVMYNNIEEPCKVGRYHSWRVLRKGLPAEFKITAEDEQANIMSITHRQLPIYGVQYHPESYISSQGERILHNFLRR